MIDEVAEHRVAVEAFLFELQQLFFDIDAPDADILVQAVYRIGWRWVLMSCV